MPPAPGGWSAGSAAGRQPGTRRARPLLIKKGGKPVAALVDGRPFDRIRRMEARFDALCQRIEARYAAAPEAEGLAEIDAAVAHARAER